MSKDQVYWMLMAFSMVKKCLPNTMGYTSYVGPNIYGIPENTPIPHFFQNGTYTFHMAVSEMTRRILSICEKKILMVGNGIYWIFRAKVTRQS